MVSPTKRPSSPQTADRDKKRSKQQEDRLIPSARGIHKDAIQAGRAPTSTSSCVDCGKKIPAKSPRWGLKFAGSPLSEPIIPLYGSKPMTMWCHAGCGHLAFVELTEDMTAAARTCHACQDEPEASGLRLVCGGSKKGTKVRQHAFHIGCWKKAIVEGSPDEECKTALLAWTPESVGKQRHGLSWDDLTDEQKNQVHSALRE
jgi:hypothetical protein